MARTATLPILNGESGLSRYLSEIRKFPMLEPQQEYMFAKRWREHDDRDAAHHLVTGAVVARHVDAAHVDPALRIGGQHHRHLPGGTVDLGTGLDARERHCCPMRSRHGGPR